MKYPCMFSGRREAGLLRVKFCGVLLKIPQAIKQFRSTVE